MSPAMISLFFTVGATTWLYTKLMKRTGNNTSATVKTAAFFGVIIFIVSFMILQLIFK